MFWVALTQCNLDAPDGARPIPGSVRHPGAVLTQGMYVIPRRIPDTHNVHETDRSGCQAANTIAVFTQALYAILEPQIICTMCTRPIGQRVLGCQEQTPDSVRHPGTTNNRHDVHETDRSATAVLPATNTIAVFTQALYAILE